MHSGVLRLARGGSKAKVPPLAAHPVGSSPGQFLGSYVANRIFTTHWVQ